MRTQRRACKAAPRLLAPVAFVTLLALGPSAARADTSVPREPDAPSDAEPLGSAVLRPKQVDARATLGAGLFLDSFGLGASADVGIARVGPGTIAVGGGLENDFCGAACWTAPMGLSQRQLWFQARASYHLEVPKIGYVDFYPLVTVGPVLSRSSIHLDGVTEYRGSDLGVGVSMGAGASYFFSERIFVGAEARVRYAGGTYTYELASGTARPFDRSVVGSWSLDALDLALALGARF